MIIQSLYIKSFGKLEDISINFDSGMNIIEGANESGKSTLAAFIRYMLYGFPPARSSSHDIPERKLRVNWNRSAVGGTMTVLVGGKSYRIERATSVLSSGSRDTYREANTILDAATGTPVASGKNAGEYFLGVPEEVYLNTAFIGQVGGPAVSSGEMNDAIENLLFSGDESINTKKAMDKLEDAARALLHKTGRGGEIFELKGKKAALEENLSEAKAVNREILSRESRILEATKKKKEAEREKEKLEYIRDLHHGVGLLAEFDKLHALEEDTAAAEKAYREYIEEYSYEGFFPDERYITELAVLKGTLAASGENYREAADEKQKAEDHVEATDEEMRLIESVESRGGADEIASRDSALESAAQAKKKYGSMLLIFGIAALAVGAGMYFASIVDIIIGALIMGLGAALAAVGGVTLGAAKKATAELGVYREELGASDRATLLSVLECYDSVKASLARRAGDFSVLVQRYERNRDAYEKSVKELCDLASLWGCSVSPGADYSACAEELRVEAERARIKKQDLLSRHVVLASKLDDVRSSLSEYEEEKLRTVIPEEKRKSFASVDMNDINTKADFYSSQIRSLDEQLRSLERETYELRARTQDPAQIYSQIDELEGKITSLEKRHRAYTLAAEALSGAGERLRDEVSPRLAEYASEIVKNATSKKYDSIGVSGDLDITFTGDGATRNVSYFSTGTRDLTYIALRLALIDLLYRETPPICFDESFAHQDNARTKEMLRAIGDMAHKGHQSLVFTCHDREGKLAVMAHPKTSIIKL